MNIENGVLKALSCLITETHRSEKGIWENLLQIVTMNDKNVENLLKTFQEFPKILIDPPGTVYCYKLVLPTSPG